jgi:hypothetical protein
MKKKSYEKEEIIPRSCFGRGRSSRPRNEPHRLMMNVCVITIRILSPIAELRRLAEPHPGDLFM